MKIKNLEGYISTADKVSCGIDYLKLNLKNSIPSLSKILNKIDDDNSNTFIKQIGDYSLSMIKNRARNDSFINISVSINDVSYTLLQYLEYSKSGKTMLKSWGSLVYYSTYFRLLQMGMLDYAFEKQIFNGELENILNSSISRIDYKLDFFYKNSAEIMKMEDIVEYRSDYKGTEYSLDEKDYNIHETILFKRLMNNEVIHYDIKTVYRKGDFQNGWTIGDKRNQSLFIRCYEKIIDTISKGKFMLYTDYFDYKNVYRLEIEFLSKFNIKSKNKFFTYKELSQLEYKIQRFLGLSEALDNEKFLYQYKENKEINFAKRLKKFKDFGGRGYSIYKLGCNPFNILYDVLEDKIDYVKLKNISRNFKEYFVRKRKRHRKQKIVALDLNSKKTGIKR